MKLLHLLYLHKEDGKLLKNIKIKIVEKESNKPIKGRKNRLYLKVFLSIVICFTNTGKTVKYERVKAKALKISLILIFFQGHILPL